MGRSRSRMNFGWGLVVHFSPGPRVLGCPRNRKSKSRIGRELIGIETRGDVIQDVPLSQMEGKIFRRCT